MLFSFGVVNRFSWVFFFFFSQSTPQSVRYDAEVIYRNNNITIKTHSNTHVGVENNINMMRGIKLHFVI